MKLKHGGAFVKRWYQELDNGRVCGLRCKKCGNFIFPAYYVCEECGAHDEDLEWAEISGKAVCYDVIKNLSVGVPLKGANAKVNIYENSLPGSIRLAEGLERNYRIYGINEYNKEEIFKLLPVEVEPIIIEHEGYKSVAWKYTGPGSMTLEEYKAL